MSDAFYTSSAHAFEDVEVGAPAEAGPSSMGDATSSLDTAFDISNTAQLILDGGFKTIGLQFPDELLPSSVAVYRALQARIAPTGAQAYVLADSTYGACCPDILSCLHLPADLLVHYGHACLTPTDAIPVHYVFPRQTLDVSAAADALKGAAASEFQGEDAKRGALVVWDVGYDWLANEIQSAFSDWPVPVSFATIERPSLVRASEASKTPSGCCKTKSKTDAPSLCCAEAPSTSGDAASGCSTSGPNDTCCSSTSGPDTCSSPSIPTASKDKAPALRRLTPPPGVDMASTVLLYLGSEGRSLLNLQMNHATNPVYAFNADCGAWAVHPTSSRLLSRRLFALHSAMAADVFGLVVGNVGLASSRALVAELREALKLAKKKSYTLSVGRLNPAKLANFAEIECFVLVGCGEGGVVDSKDFLRPIITPWELTLALKGKAGVWDPSAWTLDLDAALDEATAVVASERATTGEADDSDNESELEFSLVTGTYRTRKTFGAAEEETREGGTDVALRNDNMSLAKLESAGSMFLQTRTFQGLEPRYGLDEPAMLEQGRTGVARGYTEEKK
ncbi:hypothetical protein CcaverHIS002_0206310 [Cutaneotrichosporon cavernicola]|uniref:2-(3-amino-3-carboxypropyl)histidine synthase subunit 2 n=1 Tax=Cutaneotrichosporon cavernicola TaxID=279322 RepID=A0AA48IDV5_9TREE|nr:uncharacterized protein CcaverHIS019_0206280 [Cutaneotrichosporon cavernicola]BEI81471.1 hypothetical protein CcaverHIS002_0206310 [Cutaneotrichosporon cavernicola]BEI89266.1 hypothetical protein CcaverHIS019_0206280 [Cutaneotrichosporon cavernicola]BEI97042.1 hypothetical protein CcaverHIS631_0206310 [Cutaneotrichosporon cavernicola]BEJ04815.1 hypothetical protein CcaverHIS641_0206320 [Cutaneotrichosporon cavernicola]